MLRATTAGSLHPNKDEPDLCKKAHPDAREVTESFFGLHRHDDQGGRPRLASALGSCSSAAKSCSPLQPRLPGWTRVYAKPLLNALSGFGTPNAAPNLSGLQRGSRIFSNRLIDRFQ